MLVDKGVKGQNGMYYRVGKIGSLGSWSRDKGGGMYLVKKIPQFENHFDKMKACYNTL